MRQPTSHLLLVATALIVHPLVSSSIASADDGKDGEVGHGYFRKDGHILFRGQRIDQAGIHDIDRFAEAVGHPLTPCKDVDAASFVALSEEYSKDKNRVYYKWISPGRFWVVNLPDADPSTFSVLDFNLAKDGKRVWKGDRVIEGADAASAEVVKPHWTWKDRHRVYYQSTVIAGADPATFKHICQGFYRDAKRVWWCTDLLKDADPGSFQAYGEDVPYARDRNHVWSGKNILDGVDAKTFQHVHDHVYKDSRRVYVGTDGKEVLKADAASFVKVAGLGASPFVLFKDRSRHYLYVPSYSEIYSMDRENDVVIVWKPVWRSQSGTGRPVQGATVSARLQNKKLSEPELTLEPKFKDEQPPTWEKDKLKRLEAILLEAQKQIAKTDEHTSSGRRANMLTALQVKRQKG